MAAVAAMDDFKLAQLEQGGAAFAIDSGEKRLTELGYKQELKRTLTFFQMFAIAFTNVTLFAGIVPYFGQSLAFGGPGIMVYGWLIVLFFVGFIALSLAEICSTYPTAGSLYFWTANLAGPKWGPLASWITAWLEVTGSVASSAAMTYACAQILQYLILLATGTNTDGGYFAPDGVFFGIFCGLNFLFGVMNSLAIDFVAVIDMVSVWWQVIGAGVLIILLPIVAMTHQSADYVFGTFSTTTSGDTWSGITSPAYSYIVGLLMAQFALYGFDCPGHITEETKDADVTGPRAILASVSIVGVLGWVVILVLLVCIQGDPMNLFSLDNETGGGFVVGQILWDVFHGRYQSGTGAILLLVVLWGSFFFGGLTVMTGTVRVIYAVARDGAMPFSGFLRVVNKKTKVPLRIVWVNFVLTTLIVVPVLKNKTVFFAISAIATVGIFGMYSMPLLFRMLLPSDKFQAGPFNLGRWGRLVALIGWLWALYTCAVFLLPLAYPITWENFNYAPVAFGVVVLFAGTWWVVSARKWYRGPVKEV